MPPRRPPSGPTPRDLRTRPLRGGARLEGHSALRVPEVRAPRLRPSVSESQDRAVAKTPRRERRRRLGTMPGRCRGRCGDRIPRVLADTRVPAASASLVLFLGHAPGADGARGRSFAHVRSAPDVLRLSRRAEPAASEGTMSQAKNGTARAVPFKGLTYRPRKIEASRWSRPRGAGGGSLCPGPSPI
jgi:hypothetical protein